MFSNIPKSSIHAENGGIICVNLSASNETAFKSNLTKRAIKDNSYRSLLGYVYANAGVGESTTDMVFAGGNVIAENGQILAQSQLFSEGLTVSDIDCDYLSYERSKRLNFSRQTKCDCKKVYFTLNDLNSNIDREYSKTPFIPSSKEEINEKCDIILNLQAQALAKRLSHINAKTLVLGISGGLDST
jgi:NAD+ synthase (glutamine-hydrolysing)